MKKKFLKQDFKELVASMGYCFATDRITVDGAVVGYMYREEPDEPGDSGWRFLAGDESKEYLDDESDNIELYDVNTIANYDPTIITLLKTPAPCAFERAIGNSEFVEVVTEEHDGEDF